MRTGIRRCCAALLGVALITGCWAINAGFEGPVVDGTSQRFQQSPAAWQYIRDVGHAFWNATTDLSAWAVA